MNSSSDGTTDEGPISLEDTLYSFVGTTSRKLKSALASMGDLAEQCGESGSGPHPAAEIQDYGQRLRPILESLEHLKALHEGRIESVSEINVVDVADNLIEEYEDSARD